MTKEELITYKIDQLKRYIEGIKRDRTEPDKIAMTSDNMRFALTILERCLTRI